MEWGQLTTLTTKMRKALARGAGRRGFVEEGRGEESRREQRRAEEEFVAASGNMMGGRWFREGAVALSILPYFLAANSDSRNDKNTQIGIVTILL